MNKNKHIAADTLSIIENGFYTIDGRQENIGPVIDKAVANTILYTPEMLDEMVENVQDEGSFDTVFGVVNETTLDAARRLSAAGIDDVLCLNFASAKNPGGGFLNGAVAQEECLARASALYPTLLKANGYYSFHRSMKSCMYSHHMIYSPSVPVFKFEDGRLMDTPLLLSFITSPAVNAGVVKEREPEQVVHIRATMAERIDRVLAICMKHRHVNVILGAWGCGVFRNDPAMIAELFNEALKGKYRGRFSRVVFAVYTNMDAMIAPFKEQFL